MRNQPLFQLNKPRLRKLWALLLSATMLTALLTTAVLVNAADNLATSSQEHFQRQTTTNTPSPSPESTVTESDEPEATAMEEEVTPTPEASPTAARAQMEPLLQTDLQVISGNVQRPNGIYWYEDFLYTGCAGDFTLYRIDDTTGATTTYISGVQNAHTLYVEEGPVIWVPDFQRNALVRIDTSNSPARVDIATELGSPWGLVTYDADSFLVTQLRTDDIMHITRDGEVQVVAEGLRNPTGIALDGDYVYVANNGSARRAIEWFELDMETIETDGPLQDEEVQPLVSGLQNTTNLVIGPDGLLYFAYSLGTRGIVGRIDPVMCREMGGCTNADVEIVLWSELAAPLAGLAITPDMRMFVHTMFGAEIYWAQLPTEDLEAEEASTS